MALMIECPNCGKVDTSWRLLGKWDGEKYEFACCGARADLVEANNWLTPESEDVLA